MMKRTMLLMVLILALALAGCSSNVSSAPEVVVEPSLAASNPADTVPAQTDSTSAAPSSVDLTTDYADAISLPMQLALGALRLEGTALAVTPEQAKNLLDLWQAFTTLSSSSTTAPQELTAVENQISGTMTAEQLRTIAELRLTNADLSAFYAEQGLTVPQPPPGVTPRAGQNLSDDQKATLRATAQASGASGLGGAGGNGKGGQNVLVEQLVALLTQRAGG